MLSLNSVHDGATLIRRLFGTIVYLLGYLEPRMANIWDTICAGACMLTTRKPQDGSVFVLAPLLKKGSKFVTIRTLLRTQRKGNPENLAS